MYKFLYLKSFQTTRMKFQIQKDVCSTVIKYEVYITRNVKYKHLNILMLCIRNFSISYRLKTNMYL